MSPSPAEGPTAPASSQEEAPAASAKAEAKPAGLVSDGHRLEWHLARPPSSAARSGARRGLVIAHGMPAGEGAGSRAAHTFPELADRVARETGWTALSFAFRGAGRSPGRFSPAGWLEDLRAAVRFIGLEVSSVWLAGFGLGGTLALRAAATDPAIGGVAVLATPSDLSPWAADPTVLARLAEEAGLMGPPAEGELDGWGEQLKALDPLGAAAAIPPRPLLVVHGQADEDVPLVDARALADAAEGHAELRVVAMAGHRLRHDPRAVAILLGWLERQQA